MDSLVIPPPPPTTIPVTGGKGRFPVRRVYCVGRNYGAHAAEMGHDPQRDLPFFFQKNPDDLDCTGVFPYPPCSAEVHHEVELAAALERGGRDIAADAALDCVWGYAIALDMTRRDLQARMKEQGRPWEVGKAFARSAPIGALTPRAAAGDMAAGRIALRVNDALRQDGDLSEMIWPLPELIAHLSRYFVLAPGDVILTGTPAGVGPVQPGDRLHATIEGLHALDLQVA